MAILSPVDPLYYAMLASRALGHIVQGEYETAAYWAERAALSPGAHVLIWTIASIAFALCGNEPGATRWRDRIFEQSHRAVSRVQLSQAVERQRCLVRPPLDRVMCREGSFLRSETSSQEACQSGSGHFSYFRSMI